MSSAIESRARTPSRTIRLSSARKTRIRRGGPGMRISRPQHGLDGKGGGIPPGPVLASPRAHRRAPWRPPALGAYAAHKWIPSPEPPPYLPGLRGRANGGDKSHADRIESHVGHLD